MAARAPAAGPTPEGAAIFRLMLEVLQTFHRLRAAGAEEGAVTSGGGGSWGLMRSLAEGGPQTVPAIARSRPVSRQHIQKLADELAADGLVEFVDNPAHRRSKLLKLTPAGRTRYKTLSTRILEIADELGRGFDAAEVGAAADVVARLRAKLTKEG
ncbi:MAG: MarR family transcriptional regulator [Alphaproteobacteria bacterium]|nr:MarR family transcriptional regulator [Alphaproteobacteria bacterium]